MESDISPEHPQTPEMRQTLCFSQVYHSQRPPAKWVCERHMPFTPRDYVFAKRKLSIGFERETDGKLQRRLRSCRLKPEPSSNGLWV